MLSVTCYFFVTFIQKIPKSTNKRLAHLHIIASLMIFIVFVSKFFSSFSARHSAIQNRNSCSTVE